MLVSIAVQTHPLRDEMARKLRRCIGKGTELVFDPAPDASPRSPWRCYREALERTPADATHRLVVQDDVLVCDYFRETVELAVAARPDRVLCFFVAANPPNHRRQIDLAHQRGWTWIELDLTTWIPVVATLWPVRLIEPLTTWFDAKKFPPAFTADDEIVGRFLRDRIEAPLACVPSLVQHPDTVPSLLGRRGGDGLDHRRQANLWVGDCEALQCDARGLDWNLGDGA